METRLPATLVLSEQWVLIQVIVFSSYSVWLLLYETMILNYFGVFLTSRFFQIVALSAADNGPDSRLSTTKKAGPTKRTVSTTSTTGKMITAIKQRVSTTKKGKTVKTTRGVTLKKKPKSTTKSTARVMKGRSTTTLPLSSTTALPLSSTTPFDYPDIVDNATLPEGMFEVESVGGEVDSDEDVKSELADLVVVPSSTQKNTPKSPAPQKKVKKTTTKSQKSDDKKQRPSPFPTRTTKAAKIIKQ